YTDSKIQQNNTVINQNINAAKNESIKVSNTYTDSKYQEGVNYTNTMYDQSIHYAQNAADNAEQNANNYTDNRINQIGQQSNQRFEQLNDKIERTAKRLNAAIAGVTAISSIPYVAENSFSYGIGIGNYQNGNALAAGIQYKTSLNTNVRLSLSWDSSNNTVLGAGFAGGW
ncbi:YadA C-terminal domain-containing protein, partial [Salmonella enterica subsp. enterica serovar Muenchen]